MCHFLSLIPEVFDHSMPYLIASHTKVWMGVLTNINHTLQTANLEVRELVPELHRLTTIEGTLDAYFFEILNIPFLGFIVKLPYQISLCYTVQSPS